MFNAAALSEDFQQPSTSRTESPPSKKQSKKSGRMRNEARGKHPQEVSEIRSQPIIQPVILVVPTENIAATVDAIKRVFRSTNEAAVQVQPFDFGPAIEKATVAVGMDQPSCFDFCAQANSAGPPFFYQPNAAAAAATANASSSTEQPLLDFAQSSTFCYASQQPAEQDLQYVYSDELVPEAQVRHRTTSTSGQYLNEVYAGGAQVVPTPAPLARTFGTMVDEKVFQRLVLVLDGRGGSP
ncbi:hypothetical protein ANCCAN_26389 [Ancylostoma caninum]|uniref:Uncharacterized protein n=1 Tax=Ancylostoma caninum TaxID=29170 RepID=A0A368F6V0_ANCCA|nr:hypothetical protein ANCCAN_26389 [Ancylostoma caninum]